VENLRNNLKNNLFGAKKIAILGVGSELRADDIAGILVSQELEKDAKKIGRSIDLKVFLGYTAPENLSGEIKKFAPTHVMIIDTADIGKNPGDVALFTPEDSGGISFSTHKLPIKVLAQYLLQSFECKVIIIGIQPKTLDFGKAISKEVKSAANGVSKAIKDVIIASSK
jgi:hydrogenase 3 maturation protease